MARQARPKKLKYKKPAAARRKYYGRGYARKKSWVSKLKWPLIVALILILLFLIISVAPAFTKFITGQLKDHNASSQGAGNISSGSTVSGASSGQPIAGNKTGETLAATLPLSAYGDAEATSEFIDMAKTDGMTAIAVTIKDENGKVYYNSKKAQKYNAVAASTLELEKIAALISEKGMTPVAVMDTFKDPLAAASRTNCYMYVDGSSMWLDNSLANGGKPWLSVYNESAKKYLLSIEDDAINAGFKQIILKSVQYPDVKDLTTIKFPEGSDDASKRQALCDFISDSYERAREKGVELTAQFDSDSVAGKKTNVYYGNPFELQTPVLSPIVDSSALTGTVSVGATKVKKAAENPEKLMAAIVAESAADARITPIIYADDKMLDELIDAAKQTEGIAGYILLDEKPE